MILGTGDFLINSRELLDGVLKVIAPLDHWTEKEQTQAEVETFILDHVYQALPEPPYTPEEKAQVAQLVYRHIWQQSVRDHQQKLLRHLSRSG
jgi:type I restriction enzyme R subunit